MSTEQEEIQVIEERLQDAGWPPALVKAAIDSEHNYVVGLTSGEVFAFAGAKPTDGDRWVVLRGYPVRDRSRKYPGDVAVRVEDISWAADAGPYGGVLP